MPNSKLKSLFIPTNLVLICIVLLALFLRLFLINNSPARLTIDEMSIGYNSFSILKTGSDEWGVSYPLSFRAFGDYKLPGYIYASIPFIATFGLTNLGVKLASILAGVSVVILVYFLSKNLINSTVGLIASFIVATTPWAIQLSRIGLESNLALAFYMLGLLFLVTNLNLPLKKSRLALAGLFFGLTFYTYIAYRLIVVLLLITCFVYQLVKKQSIKPIAFVSLVTMLVILPLVTQLASTAGTARFNQINIFRDQGIVSRINQDRSMCFLSNPSTTTLCRLTSNKPVLWAQNIAENYTQFLLPSFLFISGDELTYASVPGFGEFIFILLPFFVFGIVYFVVHYQKLWLLAIPTLLAAIPSALAGNPQIIRGSALMPFIAIISALGIWWIYKKISHKKLQLLFLASLFLVYAFYLAQYLVNYWFIYPIQFDTAAYDYSPELALYLKNKEKDFDLIYLQQINPDPAMFLAFHQKIDPDWYQSNVSFPNPDELGFTHANQLGKYQFGDQDLQTFLCQDNVRVLFVTSQQYPFKATQTFKGTSGVHTQAEIYDLAELKSSAEHRSTIDKMCQ